jgi:hypothetical protein
MLPADIWTANSTNTRIQCGNSRTVYIQIVLEYTPHTYSSGQETLLHGNRKSIVVLKIPATGLYRSWGSSVSIVSDYRLDDWGSIPRRGKGFFL